MRDGERRKDRMRDKDWQLTGADVDSLGKRMSKHSSSPAWGNYFQKTSSILQKVAMGEKKAGFKKVTVSFFEIHSASNKRLSDTAFFPHSMQFQIQSLKDKRYYPCSRSSQKLTD